VGDYGTSDGHCQTRCGAASSGGSLRRRNLPRRSLNEAPPNAVNPEAPGARRGRGGPGGRGGGGGFGGALTLGPDDKEAFPKAPVGFDKVRADIAHGTLEAKVDYDSKTINA
jgi:hypothetical protein